MAYVIGPLTAAPAFAAVVMVLRPSTGRWCRLAELPGSGVHLGTPSLGSRARTATIATASVCLLTVPVIPLATEQMVQAGALANASRTVQMTLFGVLAAMLAMGVLLLLVRNTAGRWLIMVSGIGLSLQAMTAMRFFGAIGHTMRGLLPLVALTAALAALLAVFPPADGQRQKPS
ncbi:hypothetical protein ACWD1Z_35460 [Streptomyces sp. NPDC002784]